MRTLSDLVPFALTGVSGVAHVAFMLTLLPDPNVVIPPTIAGTVNALNSAAKEPSVKRVLYTSSSTAATEPKPNKEFSIDQDTWNDSHGMTVRSRLPGRHYRIRRGANWTCKGPAKQAERAAWKLVRENKANFVLNTFLPNANFGEILDPKNQGASTRMG